MRIPYEQLRGLEKFATLRLSAELFLRHVCLSL
jgi:hypothetical protein